MSRTPGNARGVLQQQAPFLALTAAVGLLRFLAPPGRVPGATETWVTVLGLWLLGILWAGLARRDTRPLGERVGDVGAQNLGIQLFIAVPSILIGLVRMAAPADLASSAFSTNALVTLVVLPLASMAVLTMLAIPVLAVVLRLWHGR